MTRQRMFKALTALALLFCVATVAMWVRSYWVYDAFSRFKPGGRYFAVQSNSGELDIFTRPDLSGLDGWHYRSDRPPSKFFSFRFHVTEGSLSHGFGYVLPSQEDPTLHAIFIPYWFGALLFALLPAAWLCSVVRMHRRSRVGLCWRCGYDLRATLDRCPECGAVPVAFCREHSLSKSTADEHVHGV